MPITLTGIAAIVSASLCVMQSGLRRSILNPYLFVCVSYFRFFGFPLDDPKYAFIVDLAHLLAFVCFSIAFFHAMGGSRDGMERLLRRVWPPSRCASTDIAPLSQRALILLTAAILSYLVLNLWVNSLIYGGFDKALVRFYVMHPAGDASPWMMRMNMFLGQIAVFSVLVTRLNYALHRRGRLVMWLTVAASLIVAFPTGSAGKFILPVLICVIADTLAALHQDRSLRPRLSIVVLCLLAVCGAMFLHVIRGTTFEDISQVVDVAETGRQGMPDRLVSAAGHAHTMISEDTAFCFRTFGRTVDFLFGHTIYAILVNPIPREMWPQKPIGFGRILGQIKQGDYGRSSAQAHGWSVAAGLAGEGYANGGYLGIPLLSLAIGYLCGKAAKAAMTGFWVSSYPILLVSLGLYRFSSMFVRGDVLSAWTATAYPLFLLMIVFFTWARTRSFVKAACKNSVLRIHQEGAFS
jgi:hypothetical protein